MKKRLAMIISVILLLATCLTFASCDSSASSEDPEDLIAFGEKYSNEEENYYVFEDDNTGYYEYRYESSSYVRSGRVEFVWRVASDGGVYLFGTKTTYHKDHTEDKKYGIPLTSSAIYFSKDFLAYSTGSGTVRYIREDSELEDLVENDD